MKLTKRQFTQALAASLLPLGQARAQAFPNHPLQLVIPFPPGGATDVAGRLIGKKLGERLGQLSPGRQADWAHWTVDHPHELAYRFGHNPAKRPRLVRAGAQLLIPDFSQYKKLVSLLFQESENYAEA